MKQFYKLMAVCIMLGTATMSWADELNVTTKYITNPSFEDQLTGWTVSNLNPQSNSSFTKKQGSIYLEKWVGTGSAVGSASATQKLSGLPAGNYRLTVAAQNIQQNSDDKQTGTSIYAGLTTNLSTVYEANDYNVTFTCNGADVTIGFRANNATGNWICVDNFRLYYVSPDLELLQKAASNAQTVITNAEKSSNAGIQPTIKANLLGIIEQVNALTEEASADEMQTLAFDLADATKAAQENADALKALKTLSSKAKSYLTKDMAASYLDELQAAYDAAITLLALEDDSAIEPVATRLESAYNSAVESYNAKRSLTTGISTANRLLSDEKEGTEEFAAAIAAAEAVCNSATASPTEMQNALTALEDATLLYRVKNGSGTVVTARTLSAVQGATVIYARAAFGSGTTREKGFCYGTTPEPTIFDGRSTTCYSNNGDIYAMEGLKPATVYYVRAYTIGSGYKVTYGDVLKVITRPRGNVSYDYDYAGDDATDARIANACEEAVWMWNNVSGIQGFHLSAHYVPGAGAGDGTADCSYGGYMRISQNSAYQKTGTVLHEGAHGLGMVSYTDWVNPIYRTNGDRGDWLGARVDRIIQFLENSSTAKLHGDYQHMWPYGINGAGEDSGAPMLYRANALLVGALAEDGIRTPNQNFIRPAYTFAQEDEVKYYIKNEDKSKGIANAFLREGKSSRIQWEEMTCTDALRNDSCAWYITFEPTTCYYTLTNVATGKVMYSYGSGNNGIRLARPTSSNASTRRIQLLPSRIATTYENYTFSGTSYWLYSPSGNTTLNAVNSGTTSAATFDHSNDATAQRWLLLTRDEAISFAEACGETVILTEPGDVNSDGQVDLTDAIMIVYYSLGQAPADFNIGVADMNNDSVIDLTDAIIVVYQSLGAE